MAADIKTIIDTAKKKGEFYMRHRTIRDRRVLSTVYLSHEWLDPDVIYLSFPGRKSHREEIALVSPIKCPAWQPLLNPVF